MSTASEGGHGKIRLKLYNHGKRGSTEKTVKL